MNSMPQASNKIMKQDNYDMVSESQYSKYDAQGGHKIAMAQTLTINENYGTRTQAEIVDFVKDSSKELSAELGRRQTEELAI